MLLRNAYSLNTWKVLQVDHTQQSGNFSITQITFLFCSVTTWFHGLLYWLDSF